MKHLADEIKRELARFGPETGLADIVAAWPAAVGETIAGNAWPARISRDGTLHVNTADSIWAFELTSRAAEIAARIGVEGVRFAPGPLPEPGVSEPETREKHRSRPSAAVRAEADRLAAEIEDESLRKIVARAAAASLFELRSDRRV